MVGVVIFNCIVHISGHEALSRTTDFFNILRRGKIAVIVVYHGTEAFKNDFARQSFLAFAAAETGNFAELPFDRSFFRIAAINMYLRIGIDKFYKFAGADFSAFAAADADFFMNDCQSVNYLNSSERTCSGTASQTHTAV